MRLQLSNIFSVWNKKSEPDKREEFERRCSELTNRLGDIRACFDMTEDNDAIDALIFEENAVMSRLALLYKQAREEGISLEHFEREKRKQI